MLYYNRTDLSEWIDVTKRYFDGILIMDLSFKNQFVMANPNISNIAFITVKGAGYRCSIFNLTNPMQVIFQKILYLILDIYNICISKKSILKMLSFLQFNQSKLN